MITKIEINGFKTFSNFSMNFTPLTIIAGANSSGKSNLFDALKLLSRLADTDLRSAFTEQRGNPIELFTQLPNGEFSSEMSFIVELLINRTIKDNWGEEATLNNTRLRYSLTISRQESKLGFEDLAVKNEKLEKIKLKDDPLVKNILPNSAKDLWKAIRSGGSKKPFITAGKEHGRTDIRIRQDGKRGGKATLADTALQTVLSGITSVDFPHAFAVKEEMKSWKYLQLIPDDLREPSRKEIGLRDTITSGGKNLAAALYRIKMKDEYILKQISRKLNNFLPNITEVNVYDEKENNHFIIKVKSEDGNEFSSRVLSEGTLRLLALCIIEFDDKFSGLLCFEEPENGIHPYRIRAMASLLKDLSIDFTDSSLPLRQVIVNTHSPALVNYINNWKDDNNVSIWFSRLNTFITQINDRWIKMKISKMSPVIKEISKHSQLSLFKLSESERKLTLKEVNDYLNTIDPERECE